MQELIRSVGTIKPARGSLAGYLEGLLNSGDEILEAGGMYNLLDVHAVTKAHWPRLLDLSRHRAIHAKAFDHFLQRFQYDLAEKILAAAETSRAPDPAEKFRALLANDNEAAADYEGRAFLADGSIDHLVAAAMHSEAAGGWKESLLWATRAFLLNPMAPQTAGRLLNTLDEANRPDELAQVLDALAAANLHPAYRWIFGMVLALHQKDHARLKTLMTSADVDKLDDRLKSKAHHTLALAAEALGSHREAYDHYVKQNAPRKDRPPQPNAFFERVQRLDAIDVGPLPADRRSRHVMMVGFPRSGTTLLENALAAHPEIETFEEIPSCESLFRHVEETAKTAANDAGTRTLGFERAREAYYREIERRARKAEAQAYVDKLPIRSANIRLLEKLMPEKKYIFSLRHPHDVVLSCFKQSFKANTAMDNFLRFDSACQAYDRVMTGWFEVFPGDSPRVHYVRYETLVTNFDDELRKVLAFLGVAWDDAVRDFAELADKRRVKTPSYAKVRQGLALGVQSSWRNFDFLFKSREAEPLRKWVKRFGYEGI